jgi:8-oxo-dGTP pyrophosphatase MutT (NUDIX family)
VKWDVHGERVLYDSPWVRLVQAQVTLPSGVYIDDYHVVRSTADAAGVVVRDEQLGVLLLWRHRFTTDTYGWEIPAGRVDDGEIPIEAGARECLEETGWAPGPLNTLGSYFPNNGQSDVAFHLFVADGATHIGPPHDSDESDRIEWVDIAALRGELAAGRITDGLSLTALTWALATGVLTEVR